MSGFLSKEAEAVLSAQEVEPRRDLYPTTGHDPRLAERSSRSPYQQQWVTASHPNMASAQPQSSPHVFATPPQYASWPSPNPNVFARDQYAPDAPHVVPSSPYSKEQPWTNVAWPTLHPDNVEIMSDSHSAFPNPADLHNFGFLLPDGRSWRCAFPNCTSQLAFTRGCDLRKHHKRHTKSLFCRHEECPQSRYVFSESNFLLRSLIMSPEKCLGNLHSFEVFQGSLFAPLPSPKSKTDSEATIREGGFSSRKDRDRHESKVIPISPVSHGLPR